MTDLTTDAVSWTPVNHPTMPSVPIPSTVSWTSERPLEIKIVFGPPGQVTDQDDKDVIVWVLSRDLIPQSRKNGHAGTGDAQFTTFGGTLHLRLSTPLMAMTLGTEARTVEDFVARTYAEVQAGEEGPLLPLTDLDLEMWLS